MTRPIPVIAFAIAAYAAHGRGRKPAVGESAGQTFWRFWRRLPPRGGEVAVRVGVVARSGEPRAVEATSPLDAEDLWLRHIAETEDGFCGDVVIAPGRLRGVVGARTIAFRLGDVRGWKFRAQAHPARAAGSRDGSGREAGAEG